MAVKQAPSVTTPPLICLSSDTKPTSGVQAGHLAYETNTGAWYIYNGSAWVTYSGPGPQTPEQINLDAQGLVAQTFDRVAVDGFTALSDQRLYLTLIPLRAGQVLTNAVIIITVAGGTLTLGKIGLYDSAFNLVAETANQTTTWETTGTITTALASAYTVPSTGGYYAAIVSSGTTRPTVAHGKASATTAEAVGTGLKPHGIQGSQTDLPDDASISGGQMPIWIGFT